MTDTIREDFEAAALADNKYVNLDERNDVYIDPDVRNMWYGYQLARSTPSTSAEPAALVERVTKAILFADCGNTEEWADNTDLGKAAIAACEFDAEHWAELYRLREEVKGPDGFATWKDAAIAERMKRAEPAVAQREPRTADGKQEAIRTALGFDPFGRCPICNGIESCDHTLRERLRAAFVSPAPQPAKDEAREAELALFGAWLRTVCFQAPPSHARDLAWEAWKHVAMRDQQRAQPTGAAEAWPQPAYCSCRPDDITGWTTHNGIPLCNVCGKIAEEAVIEMATSADPQPAQGEQSDYDTAMDRIGDCVQGLAHALGMQDVDGDDPAETIICRWLEHVTEVVKTSNLKFDGNRIVPADQSGSAQAVAHAVCAYGRIDKLVVRDDVADEYACKLRENGAEKVKVLPLYTRPAVDQADGREESDV